MAYNFKNFHFFKPLRWLALIGVAVLAWGAIQWPEQFYVSYLWAYMVWFGVSLGSLGLLLLYEQVGGAWAERIKPLLESAARIMPWLALFFIPILIGMPRLYEWVHPEAAKDAVLAHKSIYLNVPFFIFRAALCFFVWWRLIYWRRAVSILIFVMMITLASTDWLMSLEPHWFSTVYGILIMMGAGLTALCFAVCMYARFYVVEAKPTHRTIKTHWDMGNLMLAFTLFWAYLTFSQYIVIFSANLPEEITWYLNRQNGGWFFVAMVVVFGHFVIPFAALLGKINKQNIMRLRWIARWQLVMYAIELFWLIQPSHFAKNFHVHFLDVAAFLTMGSLWLSLYGIQLQRRPEVIDGRA